MFNKVRLKQVLAEYKKVFVQQQWPNEKYKWEAVQCFQNNWDINSPDFAQMLKKSLDQVGNLLTSANNFPAGMITGFAETTPEAVSYTHLDVYKRQQYERLMQGFEVIAKRPITEIKHPPTEL